MKLVRKKKITPDQLRAIWAAIPGVDFNPPPRTSEPEPPPPPPPPTPKSTDTHTIRGTQRKHLIGHPGEAYCSADEAMQILQISRPYLSSLAKRHSVFRTCRQIGTLYKPCVFYLRKDINALKQLRDYKKQQPSIFQKYERDHPGNKYYTAQQAKDLLQIAAPLLHYFTQKHNINTVKRLVKSHSGQYSYPPQTFYLKTDIRELNKKIRSL